MTLRRRPLPFIALSAAAASSFLAGCGGGSPSVANVASTTTAAARPQNGLVAYAHCMRSNGIPNFPDPQRVGGRALKLTIQQIVGRNAHFQAADRACNHLLPPRSGSQNTVQITHAQLEGELSFARCMRNHGLARFPDPDAQGELTIEMVQAQGIDVHAPAVLRTVQACLPASHGWLTQAKVRAALNNTG